MVIFILSKSTKVVRILFSEGGQRKFFISVRLKLNKSLHKIYYENRNKLGISYTTFKKYYRGNLTLPVSIADLLTEISGIRWRDFKIEKILDSNWGKSKAGKIGQKRMYEKYSKNLSKWRMRGYKKSKFGNFSNKKDIIIPKLNENLAEFLGICLGDGTLTKYFLRISLDLKVDKPYSEYVSTLGEEIFGIKPSVKDDLLRGVINVKFYSVDMCNFLNKKLELPHGDKIKYKTRILDRVFVKRELMLSCLRGLVDTDGNIGNGVFFSSKNPDLMNQITQFCKVNKIFTDFDKFTVGTGSFEKVNKYFKEIGSSNLRNIVRFQKMFIGKRKPYIKNNDLIKFYDQYKDCILPYKLGS